MGNIGVVPTTISLGIIWATILNSEREYSFPPYNFTWQRVFLPCYNSKLGYNSIFFVFGIREGG